jgi:hypothetical protein
LSKNDVIAQLNCHAQSMRADNPYRPAIEEAIKIISEQSLREVVERTDEIITKYENRVSDLERLCDAAVTAVEARVRNMVVDFQRKTRPLFEDLLKE